MEAGRNQRTLKRLTEWFGVLYALVRRMDRLAAEISNRTGFRRQGNMEAAGWEQTT